MGDETQQEDWVAGWDSYRRRLAESAAKRAYERGYKDATIDAVLSNAKTRSKPVPGSIQWAVEQLRAGRAVTRATRPRSGITASWSCPPGGR